MPSVFTHAVSGIACGTAVYDKTFPGGFWLLSLICSVLPDADVLCFRLGIPYSHFLGHRGFFHSLFFACVLGFFIGALYAAAGKRKWKDSLLFAGYFSFVISLHGVLDAFTNGGLGVALLSPFITERYFFPFTPIKVSPFSPGTFIHEGGFQIIKNEMFWVWLPCMGVAMLLRIIFSIFKRDKIIEQYR
jgi:inner membrane protein